MFTKEWRRGTDITNDVVRIRVEIKVWLFPLNCITFPLIVLFHEHWRLTGQPGREGTIFYSTLPLSPTHEHSDIYLQLYIWDDHHIFLIAPLVFIRLLLDEI